MILKSVTIVLAEDDDGHAALIERNLIRAGLLNTLIRVRDGFEALQLLRGEGSFADRKPHQPILLILDVNMPRLDGVETLRELKKDQSLAMIPVIILTTTDDPREIERCYREGCNVYISKPVAYEAFADALRRLGLFLEVVQLPGQSAQSGASAAAGGPSSPVVVGSSGVAGSSAVTAPSGQPANSGRTLPRSHGSG